MRSFSSVWRTIYIQDDFCTDDIIRVIHTKLFVVILLCSCWYFRFNVTC